MQEPSRPALRHALGSPIGMAVLLALASGALSWVYADRSMPIPDEGALLTAAVKLLHGGVFYRDVDAYALPGASYLLAGAMALFGEHVAVARALAGTTFCVTVVAVYACGLALFERRRAALCALSLLALKFLAFPIFTMYFYADASAAAALVALAVFLHRDRIGHRAPLTIVGLLTAASLLFKQSTGLLVAIVFAMVLVVPAIAHAPRGGGADRAGLAAYGAGLGLVLVGAAVYFAAHGVLAEMLYAAFLRPFTGYLPTSRVSFGPPLAWWRFGTLASHGPLYLPQLVFELVLDRGRLDPEMRRAGFLAAELLSRVLYTAIPLVFGACAWLWIRALRAGAGDRGPGGEEPPAGGAAVTAHGSPALGRFFTAAGVAFAIALSALPRADFIHVVTIYPAVILVGFALGPLATLGRGGPDPAVPGPDRAALRVRVEAFAVVVLLAATAGLAMRYDARLTHRFETPRAALWVKPQHAWLGELVAYVQREVPEGDPLFVYGHEAHWYFLTDRYTPRRFSQLYPGMTDDDTGAALAALIERTRPRVVLQGVLSWPGMPDLRATTPLLRETLERLYEPDPDALSHPPRERMLRIWRARRAGAASVIDDAGGAPQAASAAAASSVVPRRPIA